MFQNSSLHVRGCSWVFYRLQFADSCFPDINVPIYIALYLGYKIAYRTRIPRLKDVDLVSNIPSMVETEKPEIPPTTTWGKVLAAVF